MSHLKVFFLLINDNACKIHLLSPTIECVLWMYKPMHRTYSSIANGADVKYTKKK